MVVMILTTGLRLLIRFTTTHVPGSDDAVVILATVSGNASHDWYDQEYTGADRPLS